MTGCVRIVDLYRENGAFVASYPVSLRGLNYVPSEREYELDAIDTAIEDALVRVDERRNLVARIRRR
jgi:hypothetical protein